MGADLEAAEPRPSGEAPGSSPSCSGEDLRSIELLLLTGIQLDLIFPTSEAAPESPRPWPAPTGVKMDTLNTSQKADKEMWESAAKAPRVLPKGHSTSVTPVEILPPASKLARLNMSGIEESDLKTVISPVRTLTLSSVERERAVGIPLGATKFGFVYPVLDVAENIEKLNLGDGENEQWAFLLMLGGFCYFDASDRVVGLTSFTTYASETTITLQGPLDATESALQEPEDAHEQM